ncbi:hypothetical protein FTV88_2203 [Heliorestis convoluta]|uniref:Uncharacterized protein n=1 Tax=Heliorestis convoluta TaxID=356322 RepID=A0A5Q2N1X8_9FIRM|nr:hypothetical protein FTV88_2203 [Heliorestis convoluta]
MYFFQQEEWCPCGRNYMLKAPVLHKEEVARIGKRERSLIIDVER